MSASQAATGQHRPGATDRSFANVLCAVDGSRGSRAAVEQAAILAGPAGRLTLLAATGASGAGRFRGAEISQARAEHVLDSAAAIAKQRGVDAEKVLDDAEPTARAILQRATAHDLLAIGAPAAGWLGGPLSGAVGDSVLAACDVPLLVARPTQTRLPSEDRFAACVLVAGAGTPESEPLLELAARVAVEQQAQLTYLHAVGVESAERPAHVQRQVGRLREMLGDALECRVEPSPVRDAILLAAAELRPSLILMGTARRHDGLRSLGSVSRRIAHEAACSVLLVPQDSHS